MDAFALALSYGINNENKGNIIITAITVGAFHFFMPLLGDKVGNLLFTYTIIKPRYVLFFVFLILSIDMLINFFIDNVKNKPLTIIGTLFFALSVSIDSFSVGLGIDLKVLLATLPNLKVSVNSLYSLSSSVYASTSINSSSKYTLNILLPCYFLLLY